MATHHHLVLIPWMAQGHMIPMIDLARLLAARPGMSITIITTPVNAARIQPTIDRISSAGLPILFVPVRFPAVEAGLPDGCENMDSIPSRAMIANFFAAAKLMKQPLLHHLRNLPATPTCIISDVGHPWTLEIARELDIPRFIFHGYSCFSLLSIHNLINYKTHESVTSGDELFMLPGLPHRIEITRPQLPLQFHPTAQYQEIFKEIREGELTADGYVVNSFDGLEPAYAEFLETATGKKVWMIGPVSLYNTGKLDMSQRGNRADMDGSRCLSWLDDKDPRSVIYVSFGSMGSLKPAQLMELGLGLLGSKRPFVWVIKGAAEPSSSSPEVEKWLSVQFENESRCLLIRGWAPQVLILSHPAVGGFLTHCGWNSSLEGVCAGVPMLTWPLFAEQFLNEKVIVEVLGIGVSVGVKKPNEWGGGVEEEEVVVRRGEIAEAVARLMEGEERRRKAEELREKAKRALEEGGTSYLNMSLMIEYLSKSNQCGQRTIEEGKGNGS